MKMGGGGVDGMEDKREEGGKYTWTDTSRLGGRGGVKLARAFQPDRTVIRRPNPPRS